MKIKTFEKVYIITGQKQTELIQKGYHLKTFNCNDDSKQWAIDMQDKGYNVILGYITTRIKGYHNYIGFYK